ncbi:major royal jelly protein 1-like [Microplitis mediator]|uniref:major royal jelly protein 1-like n=1 Tax=Microplitis mediator TaxID=375433 RepID=UPI002554FF39|nr:major royal jelly protein 1-like [Microplitis mediator]
MTFDKLSLLLLLITINQVNLVISQQGRLGIVYQWKYVDWVWPNVLLTEKNHIIENPFTQDVDVDLSGRVFVTTPQWLEGTPITLSVVTDLKGPGGPLLTPYPHWSWHTLTDCDKLISVYRIAIDECNRLWIVDVGRISDKRICPMKIMIFDLFTDRLIHKYVIPSSQTFGMTSLVTPIVDISSSCSDAHLYIGDVAENGIVVYNLQHDISWRINNTYGNAFGPDADAMNITIVGEWFDLTDGILGMSLSPPGFFKQRYLYFNSLSSYKQKFMSTDSLKMPGYYQPLMYESIIKRPSQAGVQATSKEGVLFFQLVEYTAVACWNIERPFTTDNIEIISLDEEALQYVSGIKVTTNAEGVEELWLNTNRLQKTINKTRKPTEVNFRVIVGIVKDIIRGTKCEPTGLRNQYPDVSTWRRIY